MEEARSGKNLRGNRRGYWLRVPSSFSESNYPVSSYRVAHVLSGNRPRGKWKSKKLAADCVQCAQYKIASQLSRDCYGSFPPSCFFGRPTFHSTANFETRHTRTRTSGEYVLLSLRLFTAGYTCFPTLVESTNLFLDYDIK